MPLNIPYSKLILLQRYRIQPVGLILPVCEKRLLRLSCSCGCRICPHRVRLTCFFLYSTQSYQLIHFAPFLLVHSKIGDSTVVLHCFENGNSYFAAHSILFVVLGNRWRSYGIWSASFLVVIDETTKGVQLLSSVCNYTNNLSCSPPYDLRMIPLRL